MSELTIAAAQRVEPAAVPAPAVEFAVERYADCIEEALPLLYLHWQEIAEDKDLNQIDPDHEMYRRAEAAGRLLIVTARAGGRLIGYVVMFVGPHPHYRKRIIAAEDIHFLHRDYRAGLTGYRLIRHAIRQASARGADYATMRTKRLHDHGKLFERLGGRLLDHVYIFRTGGGSWPLTQ